jgi:hypothetical protein
MKGVPAVLPEEHSRHTYFLPELTFLLLGPMFKVIQPGLGG